jgi:hypothetical protein
MRRLVIKHHIYLTHQLCRFSRSLREEHLSVSESTASLGRSYRDATWASIMYVGSACMWGTMMTMTLIQVP